MISKRELNGSEDLIGWDILTRREQVKAFSMFCFVLLVGVFIGAALAKAGFL